MTHLFVLCEVLSVVLSLSAWAGPVRRSYVPSYIVNKPFDFPSHDRIVRPTFDPIFLRDNGVRPLKEWLDSSRNQEILKKLIGSGGLRPEEAARLHSLKIRSADLITLAEVLYLRRISDGFSAWVNALFHLRHESNLELIEYLSSATLINPKFIHAFSEIIDACFKTAMSQEQLPLDKIIDYVLSTHKLSREEFESYIWLDTTAFRASRTPELEMNSLSQAQKLDLPTELQPLIEDVFYRFREISLDRFVEFYEHSIRTESPNFYGLNPDRTDLNRNLQLYRYYGGTGKRSISAQEIQVDVTVRGLRMQMNVFNEWLKEVFPLSDNPSSSDITWLLFHSRLVSKEVRDAFTDMISRLVGTMISHVNVSKGSPQVHFEIFENSPLRLSNDKITNLFSDFTLTTYEREIQRPLKNGNIFDDMSASLRKASKQAKSKRDVQILSENWDRDGFNIRRRNGLGDFNRARAIAFFQQGRADTMLDMQENLRKRGVDLARMENPKREDVERIRTALGNKTLYGPRFVEYYKEAIDYRTDLEMQKIPEWEIKQKIELREEALGKSNSLSVGILPLTAEIYREWYGLFERFTETRSGDLNESSFASANGDHVKLSKYRIIALRDRHSGALAGGYILHTDLRKQDLRIDAGVWNPKYSEQNVALRAYEEANQYAIERGLTEVVVVESAFVSTWDSALPSEVRLRNMLGFEVRDRSPNDRGEHYLPGAITIILRPESFASDAPLIVYTYDKDDGELNAHVFGKTQRDFPLPLGVGAIRHFDPRYDRSSK